MRKLALAVALTFLLAGTAAAQNVKVGILMGFSGPLASLGPAIEAGSLLAADQVNEAGGINGMQVETVSRDTATDPGVGRDAASKLVEVDRVPAVVGALSSGVSTAVTSVTTANNVVQISPSSTAPTLTNIDDNDFFFRTCPSDALQGQVQGDLAANMGYETASVIYVNNPYGKGLADNFKKAFEAAGGKVNAMVGYEENKPSYRGEVQQALDSDPDVLNVISYPADGNKQLVSAVEQGYDGEFIFADGMKSAELATGPASQHVNGAVGTAPGALETAASRQFEKDYKAFVERTGKDVDLSAPFRKEAYDAMAVILLSIASIGDDYANMSPNEQGTAIRDAIRDVTNPNGEVVGYGEWGKALDLLSQGKKINYNGVTGPVTYDDNGDIREAAFDLWMVKNGRAATIWTVQ